MLPRITIREQREQRFVRGNTQAEEDKSLILQI